MTRTHVRLEDKIKEYIDEHGNAKADDILQWLKVNKWNGSSCSTKVIGQVMKRMEIIKSTDNEKVKRRYAEYNVRNWRNSR